MCIRDRLEGMRKEREEADKFYAVKLEELSKLQKALTDTKKSKDTALANIQLLRVVEDREDEIKDLQLALQKRDRSIASLEGEIETLNERISLKENEMELWKKKVEYFENKSHQVDEELLEEIQKNLKQEHEHEVEEIKFAWDQEKDELNNRLRDLEQKLSQANIKIGMMREANEKLISDSAQVRLSESQSSIQSAKATTEDNQLKIQLETSIKMERELLNKIDRLTKEKAFAERSLEDAERRRHTSEANANLHLTKLREIESNISEKDKEIFVLKTTLKTQQSSHIQEVKEMQAEHDRFKLAMADKNEFMITLRAEVAKYESEIFILQQRVRELEHIIVALQAEGKDIKIVQAETLANTIMQRTSPSGKKTEFLLMPSSQIVINPFKLPNAEAVARDVNLSLIHI
eukprot:TRINITY_DN31539_c0_g1_i1.p1 TRINITY_DN31539_c0_g1~~TRINITY_DN31539_c0_g1_i1.p1  ORF type:complete len:416 (+),score=122.79 TRINITY_DN31539_c0_g1_i1:33-1250(+)